MKQSELFSKTRKEVPKDEVSKNAKLLIKGGFIHKEMAGVYSFLPLGLRVLNKVNSIIREEMNRAGAKEIFLSSLQDKNVWEKTNRWDEKNVDAWFKTKLSNGGELGLGFTHEEPLTALMRDHIRSFRDLPVYVYQIQTKFRNETRAKSGLIRTREFLMKDLYSFSRDEKEHEAFYDKMKLVYKAIFERAGIGGLTYMTYASGGSFSKYSHEFQTVCEAGEDTIYLCEKCSIAVNEEIIKEQNACPECGNKKLAQKKSVEVGNIFSLGTRFSDAFNLRYLDQNNEAKSVIMGSYGIGPARLLATAVELLGKENEMRWPRSIAPFAAHLLCLDVADEKVLAQARKVQDLLQSRNTEVLFDDRDVRAGEKFADADLIGIPLRLTVSKKTSAGDKIEVLHRQTGDTQMVAISELVEHIDA